MSEGPGAVRSGVSVRVPASSANLGAGFDVLAVALGLRLELTVTETGNFEVLSTMPFPLDRSNLIVRAFETLHPADGLRFEVNSNIPRCGRASAQPPERGPERA